MLEKFCPKCTFSLGLSLFHKDKSTKDGYSCYCKGCKKKKDSINYASKRKEKLARSKKYDLDNPEKKQARDKRWALSNSEKRRFQGIKYRHGLDQEKYNSLLIIQENKCAICEKDFSLVKNFKNIHVDHDHKTGLVRAILCGKCNVALGHVEDDVVILTKMVQYLNKHGVSKLEGP